MFKISKQCAPFTWSVCLKESHHVNTRSGLHDYTLSNTKGSALKGFHYSQRYTGSSNIVTFKKKLKETFIGGSLLGGQWYISMLLISIIIIINLLPTHIAILIGPY